MPRKKAVSTSSVDVVNRNGDVIRTYSEKEHGDDYAALADSFASKEEGRSVVASGAPAADETPDEGSDEGSEE